MATETTESMVSKKTMVIVFFAILAVGIFLRTYQFHAWLGFGSDQVNDAVVVGDAIEGNTPWPLLGADMSHSGTGGREQRFHIGPMYYYFEIISGKLFGNYPDKLAYPDLLLSILSLPLLYYFLRRLFRTDISLGLTGLYAISFYMLKFSHSAWNPNSIPFFVLLFLLSLHEFILTREKTPWLWVVILGVTLGVGVQLHAILLVLLPATLFFTFLFFIRKHPVAWKQWLLIFCVALFLNVPQIWNEQKTGYANMKIFVSSVRSTPDNGSNGFFLKLIDDVNCHIQANAYMLSSIGQDDCDVTIIKAFGKHKAKDIAPLFDPLFDIGQFFSFIFSFGGYGLSIFFFRKENDQRRKHLLGLIILYATLSFFVLLPVDIGLSRYFVHTFFIPLMFLGLLCQYLIDHYPKKYALTASGMLFLFLVVSNSYSLWTVAREYVAERRSVDNTIILGEIESMVGYMIANADGQKQIYLIVNNKQSNFTRSLMFIAEKNKYQIIRAKDASGAPSQNPLFYLSYDTETNPGVTIDDYPLQTYRNFGQVGLYKINNDSVKE